MISNKDGNVVHDGVDVLDPDRRPDRQPGPLGPLPRDDVRPRRHRHPRDAAGRHPHRHRQACASRASRRSPSRPPTSSTTPARSSSSTARRSRIDTSPTWRMVVSPAKGTFHVAEQAADAACSRPVRRSATSPACRDRHQRRGRPRRSGRRVAGRGRRPGLARPAACSASTRRGQPDGRASARVSGAPHAAILGLGAYRPSREVPNADGRRGDRVQRRVDPAALRHQAAPLGRPRRDRSR